MTDPITTAIATAVAGSAAKSLTTQAGRLLTEITSRLRQHFRGRPGDLAALDAAQQEQSAPDAVASLAAALDQALAAEPEFAVELGALWQRYQAAANITTGSNVFNGTADKVIQVHGNHGDLTIN